MDSELDKFYKKIEYIRTNLTKFGFNGNLTVMPFFYVPFPPYFNWNGIKLVSSIVVLSVDLHQLLPARKLELQAKFAPTSKLLTNEPTPYALDASLIDSSLKPNTYRIQDGVINSITKNELEVLVTLNPDTPFGIWVQITDEIYKDLVAKRVDKGDIIKMALLNMNGTWSMMQMMDYSLITPYDKSRGSLDNYGLIAVLKAHSKGKDLEVVINQMFGPKSASEIFTRAKKWNINLGKLVDCQVNKGQNILTGIGYFLGLGDNESSILVQCRCGEVIAGDQQMIKNLQELYSDGKIQCKRCDPTQRTRLSAKLGYELHQINYSDAADAAELQKDLDMA